MSTSSPAASTASAASTTTSGAGISSHDMGSFPSLWAHTMRSNSDLNDLGRGAPGRLNSPGNRDTMNPVIMSQMMQDPNFAQYMSSMLQTPRIIESMLALNPFLQAMGPQAGEMLRSSQFQAMISDPETLRRVARMGSQMGCPGGTQSADTTESVGPTSSTWAGADSTDGSSSSSATRATTTPAAANELAFSAGSPASLMPNYWMQQLGALRASLGVPSPSAVKHEPVGIEERYQVELKKLNEMGFWDAAKNVRALVASSGNLNGAIELLFSGAI
ncbi:hypothetical protein BGZ75_001532 [Mortierella antarctica]|nr:hypothetical protein BGZ75_001532 [Mortierella antarctica]